MALHILLSHQDLFEHEGTVILDIPVEPTADAALFESFSNVLSLLSFSVPEGPNEEWLNGEIMSRFRHFDLLSTLRGRSFKQSKHPRQTRSKPFDKQLDSPIFKLNRSEFSSRDESRSQPVGRGPNMKKEKIIEILKSNRALLEEFHVCSLSVFGSIVRGEADPESDVDILVEFEPGADIGLFEFIRLRDALSDLIGMPVDMGTPDALHPALKDDILREALHVA